jgi:diguanylate cyclase (GGDEF)-like protein/PAS domain S-box-containing protein
LRSEQHVGEDLAVHGDIDVDVARCPPLDVGVAARSNEMARAAAALRSSNDLVIFFAADGTIEWASPACEHLLGFRPEEVVGLNGLGLIHPDDQARAIEVLMSIPNIGDQATADFRVIDAHGRIRWIEETATNLLDDPTVGSVVGNLRDVTERVALLERVELDRRRLAAAQAAARLGSFELDLDTGDLTRSDELCRILGVPIGSAANASALDIVHPDDRHKVIAMLQQAAAGQGRGELDYRIVRPTGEVRWVRTHGVRLPGTNANLIAGTMLDITDRHAADEALRFQATHDWLTGLPNPATLHDNLRHMLASVEAADHVMVAAVGIDNLRQITDVSGSLTGDDAVRSVAARICAWTGPDDLVGRIRGDEFVVARNSRAAETDAVEFGRRLKEALGESVVAGDDRAAQTRLSFSVGIATTSGVDSPDTIIADADAAMDDASRNGGDRVVVFDDDARARATRRRNIAAALALALERDELHLEYQPIVDLTHFRTIGFEALLRWTHPDLGDISPAEFVPIAEFDNLIGPIGTWVVDQAMQQLAEWRRDPRVPADLWMAVNVSAQQLSHGRLADRVRESLGRSGVPADAVHLEITEGVLVDRSDHALTTIAELHSLGVNLSIDDFGTGYSSLSYLSRLPVDCLKIDRAFVHALSATRGGTPIVRAIITLAHSLELSVVAEGVETAAQLETLRELGCTSGQGFLWSRALPPHDALQWMVA